MKALCLKEPFASMLFHPGKNGYVLKSIETRKWNSHYRGDLAIVVSQAFDNSYEPDYDCNAVYWQAKRGETKGLIIGIVNVIAVAPMFPWMEQFAQCKVYPKAHAFFLRDIREISPVKCKGQLGIFNIPNEPNGFRVTKRLKSPWDYRSHWDDMIMAAHFPSSGIPSQQNIDYGQRTDAGS